MTEDERRILALQAKNAEQVGKFSTEFEEYLNEKKENDVLDLD